MTSLFSTCPKVEFLPQKCDHLARTHDSWRYYLDVCGKNRLLTVQGSLRDTYWRA